MSVFCIMGSIGYGEPLKKSCLVKRDILPMSMNTHIIYYVLITHITQGPMRINSVWVLVVIAPYWEERG